VAKKTKRDDELSTRPKIRERLLDVFRDVEQGYGDQRQRADDNLDWWDLYNCKLGERQFYSGNSQIFLPFVKDAIKARKTRFVNQIFPRSGRYVEVTTTDETLPFAQMALLENYVRRTKLRTQIMPALLTSGDVEGQYSLYVSWKNQTRHVVSRETSPVKVAGLDMPELGEVESIEEDEQSYGMPHVEIINDADLLVLPVTSDSINDAIEDGGSVTVIRRWTKARLKRMIEEGEVAKEPGEALVKAMTKKDEAGRRDTKKALADAAGIRMGGSGKYCQVYETWTKLKVDGDHRICRAYYGGDDQILGCKLNPYWCDEVPVISAALDKSPGVFKGRSPCEDVVDTQVFANDTINEAADSAHFSAMPIIMTDPEKNPRTGTMVLGLAALWETSPNDTKFAQFPELWKDGLARAEVCKQQIFQTLGVNPAMIPQATGAGTKRNQAEIANEQQVDILTTADAVTNLEEGILTPLIQRFIAYDHQFREEDVLVRGFGEMGMRAIMEDVPPIQLNKRWEYRWFGVEAARNAAQVQQQIAGLNVLKGIPPNLYPGYQLNIAPAIVQFVESTFGPRLSPLIFKDLKSQLAVPPEKENPMIEQGLEVAVHPMDDDVKHIQVHMQVMAGGDVYGTVRAHILRHQQSIEIKTQAMQAQQQGLPGSPGGAGPGVAGTPQPGAQPQGPRLVKGPPGMIAPESLPRAGAVTMPRKY
jgi:hypothetical protein